MGVQRGDYLTIISIYHSTHSVFHDNFGANGKKSNPSPTASIVSQFEVMKWLMVVFNQSDCNGSWKVC